MSVIMQIMFPFVEYIALASFLPGKTLATPNPALHQQGFPTPDLYYMALSCSMTDG
jgi:hypothetical protein